MTRLLCWTHGRLARRLAHPALLVALLVAGGTVGCGSDQTSESNGNDNESTVDAGVADTGATEDTGSDDTAPEDTGVPETTEDTSDTGKNDTADPPPPEGSDISPARFTVLPPRPASCSSPGTRQRIPFYFQNGADDSSPVIKWDRFQGSQLTPNKRMGAGTIDARRTRVAQQANEPCSSASDCPSPLKCAESGLRGARKRCVMPTSLSFIPGSAQMDYRTNLRPEAKQLITVVVENTASYEGRIPGSIAGKYAEDGQISPLEKPGRATDPRPKQNGHRQALVSFARRLPSAVNAPNTKISFWYYGGTARVQARAAHRPRADKDHFKGSLSSLESWVETNEGFQNYKAAPANTYQAMIRAINQDLGIEKYSDHEKFMLLITDGPNEVYDKRSKRQKVLDKLKKHDVHLVVMHLDAEVEPDLMYDVPSYWKDLPSCSSKSDCKNFAPTCESDADCASFETCRRAVEYAEKEGDSVGKSTFKHCMPDYSGGQLGPIDAYADLACRTDGHYLYLNEPDQFVWYAKRLPYIFDGQWSVAADVSAFDPRLGLENDYYRLSGVFFGLLGANLSSVLSDVGSEGHPTDTRPLLRLDRGDQ